MALRAIAATLLLSSWGACTYPTNEGEEPAGPDQTFKLVRSEPAAGALDVSPNRAIDLRFNFPPDGDTVVAANVRVFAGLIETPGKLKADLLQRKVSFTPTHPLRPGLRHQVYVHGSLTGLNGARLGQTVVFNFTTGDEDRSPRPPPPTPVGAGEIQPIWDRRCSACHRPPAPPAGLDLSSRSAAVAGLKGVPSAFADRLLVFEDDHSRSYLMLKLLGVGGFVGFPMPPQGPPLVQEELRQVATWIDGGAPP